MKNAIAVALLAAAALTSAAPHRAELQSFTNGHWFNGQGFVDATMYVRDGQFASAPASNEGVDVIDLGGQFVIPPLADAHAHNISLEQTPSELKPYLQQGIFYVMNPSNLGPAPGTAPTTSASAVEIAFANGPLTPTGGHPVELNTRAFDRGGMPGLTREQLDGRAFFVADTPADVARVFPAMLAGRPSVIKVYLGFIEEYERRRDDPAFAGRRGVSVSVLREAVRLAHQARLRVAAHIETAADFREAVSAGVDIIEHLPGWRIGAASGFDDPALAHWLITDDVAAQAAAAGTTVVTTTIAGKKLLNASAPEAADTRVLHTRNLRTLRAHGVKLALGSDYYEGTAMVEAFMLGTQPLLGPDIAPLGIFSNLELLKLWTEATPQLIFPGRRIGTLTVGAEASFIVLRGNPVDDFANVRRITQRFSHGRVVSIER